MVTDVKNSAPAIDRVLEALIVAAQDESISEGLRERARRSLHNRLTLLKVTRH